MIRLRIVGVDESRCRELSRRLRDAALVSALGTDLVGKTTQAASTGNGDPISDPTAVAFVGPQSPSADVIECLIRDGSHVLLATDALPPREVLDAAVKQAASHGVEFVVANPDRTFPSRQLIFDEIASGKLGVPGLIRIHRWESDDIASSSGLDQLPGGLIRDLDVALWLKDRSPNVVFATGRTGGQRMAAVLQVHLGFGDSAMALIDYTSKLPAGDGYQSLSVIGSHGAAYADDHPNRQLLFSGGSARAELADAGLLPLTQLLQSFVNRLSKDDESSNGTPWWRQVDDVARAVRQSLQTGQAVSLEGS